MASAGATTQLPIPMLPPLIGKGNEVKIDLVATDVKCYGVIGI
jgi:hypothetical protein